MRKSDFIVTSAAVTSVAALPTYADCVSVVACPLRAVTLRARHGAAACGGRGQVRGGAGGSQKGVVTIKDLEPGKGYTFVVHSYTDANGHSTESDASDPIELPTETKKEEEARRKKEEEAMKAPMEATACICRSWLA